MKTKKNERTVAAILSTRPHGIKGVLRQFRSGDQPRRFYIYCRSTAIAKRFLKDAEREGFLFGDGMMPTAKDTSDIFALKSDFTICYTGIVAHQYFGLTNGGNVLWIDYGKYLSGEKDYQARRTERPKADAFFIESLRAGMLQNNKK